MKKTETFTITIDKWMIDAIEEMAKKTNMSRSGMIKILLKSKLNDLGYSETLEIIEKLRKIPNEPNDEQKLLG